MTNIEELNKFGFNITEDMKQGKVIVDVYTTWCGPCKFVAPILHNLRDQSLIKLIQVDLDQNRPLGEKFGITAIPTLLFFKDGELVNHSIEVQGQTLVQKGMMIGAAGEPILREIIEKM